MTVYLVNPTTDDTSAAREYGEIVVINKRYVYGDEIIDEGLPPTHLVALSLVAMVFNPLTDYLLLCGDHLQITAMASMLGSRHKEWRVLRWDRIARGYFVVKMRGKHNDYYRIDVDAGSPTHDG